MSRSGKRNYNPGVRPVIRAELSDKNRTLRWILIIGFLVIALISLVIGLRAALVTEPGWELVESASTEVNCSADFVVSYCYGQTEEDASTEKKRLTLLYSDAAEDAYRIFTEELQRINESINQPVTVDPALYDALTLVEQYDNRFVYLAPVYAEYNRIFLSSTEQEAADFDPNQNPELVEYIAQAAAFANDSSMVDLELLADGQVRLNVSDAYVSFAQQYEITEFLDFGWMTNAFVADYLADVLARNGFTNGFVSSYDGFTRNLDNRGEQFSLNLFDRQDTSIYLSAIMQYNRPISIVFLRDFPMSPKDSFHYYAFSNGRVVTTFVDPADGMSKSSVSSLTGYSYDLGCAEVLLQLAPVFVSDMLDADALEELTTAGIHSLWFDGRVLYCNDADLCVKLNESSGIDYTVQYTK